MLYAISSFFLWGLFPLYFKLLQEVASFDIVVQRIFWSLIFLAGVLTWRRQWGWLGEVRRQPRVLLGFLASALLLSGNWLMYIWAVNSGRIVDASLGYFMSPLVSVLLGYVILKEKLRLLQWLAVLLAAAILGIVLVTAWQGHNSFLQASPTVQALLVLSGPVTAIPLLMFAAAARRIPLSLLGLLQYISPTMQLLTGVFIYDEAFTGARLTGFMTIWVALAVYSLEGLWRLWAGKTRNASA